MSLIQEQNSPISTILLPICWQRGLRRAQLSRQRTWQPSAAVLVFPPPNSMAALQRCVWEHTQNNLVLHRDSPVQCREAHRASSPANSWTSHIQILLTDCNRWKSRVCKVRTLTMGICEVYCSKYVVILWWNVLFKCKLLSLSQTKIFIFYKIPRNSSAFPCLIDQFFIKINTGRTKGPVTPQF